MPPRTGRRTPRRRSSGSGCASPAARCTSSTRAAPPPPARGPSSPRRAARSRAGRPCCGSRRGPTPTPPTAPPSTTSQPAEPPAHLWARRVGRTLAHMARDGWPALFASAFTQSKNPMALVDADRRHLDANAAYLRLLGRPRNEVVGHHVWDFVAGGAVFTLSQWNDALAAHRFHGEAEV